MGLKDRRVLCDIRGMKLLVSRKKGRYCRDESARVWFESRVVHYELNMGNLRSWRFSSVCKTDGYAFGGPNPPLPTMPLYVNG